MSTPYLPSTGGDGRTLAMAVNRILQGGLDNLGDITLSEKETDTQIRDARLSKQSVILLMPKTAEAAAALSSVYVAEVSDGAAILRQSMAGPNRIYRYLIFG